MIRTFLIGAAASTLLTTGAWAAGCAETVEQFAQARNLTIAMPARPDEQGAGPTTAPATMESRGVTATDRLGASGGVIQPPPTGNGTVMTPPPTADRMPTAPRVEPGTPSGPVTTAKPPEAGAAARAQAEAMLFAAKSAAQEGREDQCFERLQQAKRLIGEGGERGG